MSNYRFETLQVHAGQESPDISTGARAVPIYATTSYVFDNSEQAGNRFALKEGGNIYTRLMNPTSDVFEKRIAALEGGVGALATASGQAAITLAIRNITTVGENIVSSSSIYGGTYSLFENTLKEQGIAVKFVTPNNKKEIEDAIDEKTKLIYAETLGNPNSDIADIEALSEIAHKHGIPLIVDNTFATPYCFKPLEHGADIVVHSATKYIGGHGTVMGGVVVDGGKFKWDNGKFLGLSTPNSAYHGVIFTEACGNLAYVTKMRTTLMRDEGATISPFNSFLLLQGLETLSLRMERHVYNALKVIDYLKTEVLVKKINHPSCSCGEQKLLYDKHFPNGAGAIFTIEIKGGESKAKKFTESLKLFSLLANVADVKSLVIHPFSTTHAQMSEEELSKCNITRQTVRLSIGTEHIDDIISDLKQAFDTIR